MKNAETRKSLYFGNVTALYCSFLNAKTPKQLDQIDTWFQGLLIFPRANSRNQEPEYDENRYLIFADWDDDYKYYAGGTSNRVTQIVGRLIGTAKSNQEKGRKDAELIRKHIANVLVTDFSRIEKLQKDTEEMLSRIPEDRIQDFHYEIFNYMLDLVDTRNTMSDEEKNDEPFPFDDYVFDDLIYNVAYQLHLFSYEGLVNAYLWLLLGGFLRNQVGSLTKMFHSGFVAINRQLSEYGTLSDKINFLFDPDKYYSTYSGDDVDSKYPDTTWICDNPECKAILNQQEGFDDNLPEWKCKDCGMVNKIDISVIFNSEEDYLNGRDPVNPQDYKAAIEDRKCTIDKKIEMASKILIDKYKDDPNLTYEGYLIKDEYFYGWFEEKDSSTADGVHICRININTLEIEEDYAIAASLFWHISLNDFISFEEESFE